MLRFLLLFVSLVLWCESAFADPLRVYIRSGPKSHGPGAHDHPSFLRDWVPLLNARGAVATGADAFPSQEELDRTDVLIIHRDGGGDFSPEERSRITAFTERGGGVVVIHAGCVAGTPERSDFFKELIGGSWRRPVTLWKEGPMNLYFTDRANPITKDCSNFEMDDEIYYDMDVRPDIRVLAGAYTPKPVGRNDGATKRAQELTGGGKKVSVYDIQPQMWTYEKDKYRAFVCIPGHHYANFSRPNFRAVLLRGIAWAGKRQNVDELCLPGELGDNLRYVEGGPVRPSEAASKLEVHPEFDLKLVASEPLVNKVMNVDWDSKGRMWVCETPEYPNGRRTQNTDPWKDAGSLYPGIFEREPQDRISWLEDTNGDGVMDKKHVFADKLELVTSFVFHKNGVIACAAPDIWLLEDTQGKGVCDKRTKLYTGLGDRDTHAVINNMRWGNDGWIYATNGYSTSPRVTNGDGTKDFGGYSAGVIRFKPDGSAFEQYSSKGSNTWGLNMTWDGQAFYTQPTCGEVLMHVALPESILAKGKLKGTNSYNVLVKGQPTFPLMKWEQQAYVQIDQVGFYTAAAGCAIYEGGAWPARWNYSYFTTEPTINLVSHFFVSPDGVTYRAEKEKGREETEFIRSNDLWYRPIEARVGPDGALYIVDFYNQAVIHNDTRGPQHGPANAAVRPDRDHYFARVWRLQHKQAKKLEVPDLSVINQQGLVNVIKTSPNAHTRFTAARLMRERGGNEASYAEIVPATGSKATAVYTKAERSAATAEQRAAIVKQFVEASDPWTRSALVAAAVEHATAFISDALAGGAPGGVELFVGALLPSALNKEFESRAPAFVRACADSKSGNDDVRGAVLGALATQGQVPGSIDAPTVAAIKRLLNEPAMAALALPLASTWDKSEALKPDVDAQVTQLLGAIKKPETLAEVRIKAVSSLLSVFASRRDVLDAIDQALFQNGEEATKISIVNELGSAKDMACGRLLVDKFGALSPALQNVAFNQLVKRPEWTNLLLIAMQDGAVKLDQLGPGNVERLRNHPNKETASAARKLLDVMGRPAAPEKNKLLVELTPQVEKTGGDIQKGRQLFTTVCTTCHKLGGVGMDVGPALDGMGAHSAADLLVAVVDPNREVDPSFYAWNIVKKNGETLVGVIAQENSSSLQLRSPGGTVEILKDQIASRENTKRSLMPEGFEALGAESLRDLMAYLNSTGGRFQFVNLSKAFTADTRNGLFAKMTSKGDTIHFEKFGSLAGHGIPFTVVDPEKSLTGWNVVVLKGGPSAEMHSKSYPQAVEVPVHAALKKLHILGGVGGWAGRHKGEPVMSVTALFEDGGTEEFVLRDAEHFADYNGRAQVPDSVEVGGMVKRGQLRVISLELKKSGTIRSLKLQSTDSAVAPVVVAITGDKNG